MKDVIIVGGGIGGLVTAIQLAKKGVDVMVIEKKTYPQHKVCGEYISNEVVAYLKSLDAYPEEFKPAIITKFHLTSVSGRLSETDLDLGGFGISRYVFDHYLFEKAKGSGAIFRLNTEVIDISYQGTYFNIVLNNGEVLQSKVAVGAYGKRAKLDRQLTRQFMLGNSPYVGIKYHIKNNHPQELIALHNFVGGYCGISRVENNKVNLCYLCEREQLRKEGSIDQLESNVLYKNPHLRKVFSEATFLFDKPLVINEISFAKKSAVVDHILMVGDTAGLITPACGNGMAMAIQAAKLCSTTILEFLNADISRATMENSYSKEWKKAFDLRLWVGRNTQKLFGRKWNSALGTWLMANVKPFSNFVVKYSHGQPF